MTCNCLKKRDRSFNIFKKVGINEIWVDTIWEESETISEQCYQTLQLLYVPIHEIKSNVHIMCTEIKYTKTASNSQTSLNG